MSGIQNAIGGYFELELPFPQKEYHSKSIALNSGRFCLEYILRCRKYSKIYVPYFICDSAIEPIIKLGISYSFYHIDLDYRIIDNIVLSNDEAIIYTNYWGLKGNYCLELSKKYGQQLILDYTQAFYDKPISRIDTFYSCRKFFGVPDGGYLYTDIRANFEIEQDTSFNRIACLVKRIDISAEGGFNDFRKCSDTFHNLSICFMSKFTKRMMQSINYEYSAMKRRANYEFLYHHFGGEVLKNDEVPMIFPYRINDGQILRQYLIKHKIFVAKYWPNVEEWAGESAMETWMANNILPIPIDQRYGIEEMKYIVEKIIEWKSLR